MTTLYQAVNVKAPEYRTTTGPDSSATAAFSSQILYTVAAATKVNELPERFHGKYIRLHADVDCQILFSDNSTQVVDNTVAATDAGATSTNLGGKVIANQPREFRVPSAPVGGATPNRLFFARQAGGNGTILIELASD